MPSEILVMGFGSANGDDAVGWEVVGSLSDLPARRSSDPLSLAEIPASCELLIVVDACRGTGAPGTIRRFRWPELPATPETGTSTHGWDLAAGLHLAESLRRLPPRVVIFTVEAGPVEPGSPPSRAVADAVPRVVGLIRDETCMNSTVDSATLAAMALFAPLTDDESRRLAAVAMRETVAAGAVVFRAGENVRRFWIVESGTVAIEIPGPDRRPRRLHTVGPGELLGWSPLLGSAAMTATGRALEPVTLVSFDAEAVLRLCESDPAFGFRLMRSVARALAARLNATRLQLLDAFHLEIPVIAEETGP